jgi:hypothetical protein
VSDHILNHVEELNGKLPEDKEKLLGIIDGYFLYLKKKGSYTGLG